MSGNGFSITDALDRLSRRESLSAEEATSAMQGLLSGRATPAQVGAFLMGLRQKGETVDEIRGLARGMRDAAVKVRPEREDLIDLCGTGGDGSGSFNISTAASLVVAACGVPVAKHGNRSASSLCGSADVLEVLGVPTDLGPEAAARSIDELGFAFLFARAYHPAMRHVAGPRSELRLRTVFNILGPMTSPAGVKRQLVGIFDDALRAVVARVLRDLGSERVWVVHGAGGLDEMSISGETRVTACDESGSEEELTVSPADAGLAFHGEDEIRGGDARRNAEIIEALLRGEKGACRDAALLNAAAALVVHGEVEGLLEGAERAADALDSGKALRLLESLRRFR